MTTGVRRTISADEESEEADPMVVTSPSAAVAITITPNAGRRKRGGPTTPGLASTDDASGKIQRRRQRRTKKVVAEEVTVRARLSAVVFLSASVLYLYLMWRAQTFLDSLESRGNFRIPQLLRAVSSSASSAWSQAAQHLRVPAQQQQQALPSRKEFNETIKEKQPLPTLRYKYENLFTYNDLGPPPDKFLVFHIFSEGQGAGNIMNGLLAAHLFAMEFNRTVCVHPTFEHFHMAFEPVHPHILATCPQLLATYDQWEAQQANNAARNWRIELINYMPDPVNECRLKELLQDPSKRILQFLANTYPRWPVIPFEKFFFYFYKPKEALLQILPYDPLHPPLTAVHLRAPDGEGDERKGLDNTTLALLKDMLPQDTYLVTNRVAFYDYFPTWAHPPWNEVKHSAVQESWGDKHGEAADEYKFQSDDILHMWADWYTVLTADQVIHTHSDFSISAIHWVDSTATSRTCLGLNPDGQSLHLVQESWKVDGETPRLLDRTLTATGTQQLRNCEF